MRVACFEGLSSNRTGTVRAAATAARGVTPPRCDGRVWQSDPVSTAQAGEPLLYDGSPWAVDTDRHHATYVERVRVKVGELIAAPPRRVTLRVARVLASLRVCSYEGCEYWADGEYGGIPYCERHHPGMGA